MWRSQLFVPVLEPKFIAKAADRDADAVVLDLEASIASSRKGEARRAIKGAVAELSPSVAVSVRINPLWLEAIRDLEVCVIEGVTSIQIARCENARDVEVIDGIITELELARGLVPGAIKLVAMLESPGAVLGAEQIAKASTRMLALTLGVEDYATCMGVSANVELLKPAAAQVIQAARSAGLSALVVPDSMADFRDLDALDVAARHARLLGSTGGYAVHPAQVAVLNDAFSPTETELDWARRILDAASDAERNGVGVFEVDGQMIDLPLISRAQLISERATLPGSDKRKVD